MLRHMPPVLLFCAVAAAAAAAQPVTGEEAAFRKLAAERYLQFTEAVRQRVLTPESCPFSPASVVLNVGTDPKALAEFVQKWIAYEPYVGVVRGVEGTLAAKSGGDWDRAVLLQALLGEAGYPSRLRVARRSEPDAATLVDRFLQQPATIASWYEGLNPEKRAIDEPTALLQEFGIPAENRALYADREAGRLRRLIGESLDAAAVEIPHLTEAMASIKAGQPFDAWRAALLTGAAERVEVEVDGIGVLPIAPDTTPFPADSLSVDTPPAEKLASLGLRLAFTTIDANNQPAAEEVRLLERELPLGSLFRKPIRVEIVPCDDAAANKATATWTKADWHRFVTGFRQFQAMLRVGDEWETSKVFDLTGHLHSVSADGRVAGSSEVGGAVGKSFGGFGGIGGESEPANEQKGSRLEALTLTMTLRLPGEEPQVQQRLIYGKERPSATPVFNADLLAAPGPISAHATTWMMVDAVARNAPLATRLVTSEDPRKFEQTGDAVRFPKMLHDWQAMRLMLAQRAMASDAGLTVRTGPMMVARWTHLVTDASEQSVTARQSMDVTFDRSLLMPRTADKADVAATANMSFGVAATVLESALLRAIDPAHGTRGAFSVFEEARAIGAKAAPSPANPPAVVAWSLERNEAGRTLIFPGTDAASAWWSVDRITGHTIGRGDGGEGQSAMEYLQITKKNIENLKCMVGMSNQVLGGSSDREIGQAFLMCMTGTDNSGSGHGIPGGIEGAIDPDNKLFNIGIGPMADALGGAKDLYDIMNKKDPILFKGR